MTLTFRLGRYVWVFLSCSSGSLLNLDVYTLDGCGVHVVAHRGGVEGEEEDHYYPDAFERATAADHGDEISTKRGPSAAAFKLLTYVLTT